MGVNFACLICARPAPQRQSARVCTHGMADARGARAVGIRRFGRLACGPPEERPVLVLVRESGRGTRDAGTGSERERCMRGKACTARSRRSWVQEFSVEPWTVRHHSGSYGRFSRDRVI